MAALVTDKKMSECRRGRAPNTHSTLPLGFFALVVVVFLFLFCFSDNEAQSRTAPLPV